MFRTWLQEKLHSLRNTLIIQHIQTRDTLIESLPFRHVVIDNVFPENFYKNILKEFKKVKDRGLSNVPGERDKLSPMGKYDASVWSFPPDKESPLLFFYSKEWRDYLSNLFELDCTNDINGCFHHHKINSEPGWVHNDYTAVTFKNAPEGKMNPWYLNCPHQTDVPLPQTHTGIRAIAILYYLSDNTHWTEGDGGETGLYGSKDPASLIKKVAPLNNRLLLFEVSPNSYHGFIKNIKNERNCIVQWLHQDPQVSLERFHIPYEKWRSDKPIVLFTGAGGKLGKRFVKEYSSHYNIIGIGRHKPASLDGFFDFFEGDITTDAQKIISQIKEKYKMIDVLVNNAVKYVEEPLLNKDISVVRKELETNVIAPYTLIQEIFNNFWKESGSEKNLQRNRSIVNVSSIAGVDFYPDAGGVYSASKAALNMLTIHFSRELSVYGIRTNALAPAGFDINVPIKDVVLEIGAFIESNRNSEIKVIREPVPN